jgi:MFS family permease
MPYLGIVSAAGHHSNVGPADGLWAPARRSLTTGLVLSTTFIAAEAMAVITIMPRVARDLGGLNLYGWVFSAFMLGSLVGTVAAGRAADRAGPARPFALGLVLFGLGLTVAGLAPSMGVLVLGRVLQGLGAGAVPAVSYVAIGRGLPRQLRVRMLAVLSTAWVLPGLVGPVLSVVVTDLFGWRWVFIGLTPLVALAGLLALPALLGLGRPETRATVAHSLRDALCCAAGAGLLLGALTARNALVLAALILCGLAVSLPALRRLLPAGTLAARAGLPATILCRGLLTFSFFGCDAFVTLAITTVLHHSAVVAGVTITASTLAWATGAWAQVRLSTSWEGRRLIRVGLILILAGIAGMILALEPGIPIGEAVAAWTIAGFGMGLAYAPTSLMMLRETSPGREGWSSASLNLAEVLGTALGTGLGGAAIVLGANQGWAMSRAVAMAFAIAGSGAAVALGVSRRLPLHGPASASVGLAREDPRPTLRDGTARRALL